MSTLIESLLRRKAFFMEEAAAATYEISHFQLPNGIWYTCYKAQTDSAVIDGMAERAFVHEASRQVWRGLASGGGCFRMQPPERLIDVHPGRVGNPYAYRLGYEWRALNIMLPLIVEGNFTPKEWYDPICQKAPSTPRCDGLPWCVSLPEALWGFLLSGHSDFESIAPLLQADHEGRLYLANRGTVIYLDVRLQRVTFHHNLINHRLFGLIVDGNQAWLPEDEKYEARTPAGTTYYRLPGGGALEHRLSSQTPALSDSSIRYDRRVPFDQVKY